MIAIAMSQLAAPLAALSNVTLNHYLVISGVLFCFGVATIVTKKNAVWLLLGVELILNAAALNFVAFSYYGFRIGNTVFWNPDGQVTTMFVIMIAAAEAAVALAIVMHLHQRFKDIDVERTATLKD